MLVNNAGISLRGTIEEFSAEDFARQQQVNDTAPFLIIQAGLPRLADAGRIVNVSSGATRVAIPDIIGYTMTKGALDALTLPLAQHLGPRGITVNAVVPATIDTDMNASWLRGNSDLIANLSLSALGLDGADLHRQRVPGGQGPVWRGNARGGTGPSGPSPGRYSGADRPNDDSTTRLPA